MSLNQSSPVVRPYAGRDAGFAAAMRRAEEAAEPKASGPSPNDPVARTRSGCVVRRSGEMFRPGAFFDADTFNALPLHD